MPRGARREKRPAVVIGSVGSVLTAALVALYPHSDEAQWLALAIIVVVILGLAVYARLAQEHHQKPPQSSSDTTAETANKSQTKSV